MTQEEKLQSYGKVVIDSLSPLVKWQYNDFHRVMLAEFSVDKQQQVMAILQQHLPCQWDVKTVKKAPAEIHHKAGFFAKLVKNQLLLSLELKDNPQYMVAWWPWGHGATVSVRLFLTNTTPYQAKPSIFQRVSNIFA